MYVSVALNLKTKQINFSNRDKELAINSYLTIKKDFPTSAIKIINLDESPEETLIAWLTKMGLTRHEIEYIAKELAETLCTLLG